MADFREIERNYRRLNLDRRITWRPLIHVGRDGDGEAVNYSPAISIWTKRTDSSVALLVEGQDALRTEHERGYLVRGVSRLVQVPQDVLDMIDPDIPADGRVGIQMSAGDTLLDDDGAVSVREVRELERRRWNLIITMAIV